MKTINLTQKLSYFTAFCILLLNCAGHVSDENKYHRGLLFNTNWKFFRGDTTDAQQPAFNDEQWRILDLPHDWSIEDLPGKPSEEQIGPFSKESPGGTSTGYVIGGKGWYRKHFTLDRSDSIKTAVLIFDGVYMESDVWVNGKHAGFHAYGYTPFWYDITPYLRPAGEENIIAVRVKNIGKNSRWYSGSGIYRNVWLAMLDPLHIDIWGVNITTHEISDERAGVKLSVCLKNNLKTESEYLLAAKIKNPGGKIVAETKQSGHIVENGKDSVEISISIPQPEFWSPDYPNVYTAEFTIMIQGQIRDVDQVIFGIRSIEYSVDNGFLLNGEPLLLKGGCMHHDNGLLGAAAFDRAEERRVQLMKNNGFNAIRTSHNPPSQAFLDACDRYGMLVIDEAFDMWERPKRDDDYHRFFTTWWRKDLQSMLLRDRNHPSIIMWSIGNEVSERADTSGLRIAHQLIQYVHQFDTTRPITNAICDFWDHRGRTWDETAPAFELLDIGGYNYQWRHYTSDHEKFPDRIMFGSESIPGEAWENWMQVIKNPYVIGDFVWTGMDYLGETGIGHAVYRQEGEKDVFAMTWPWYNAWCGDIDICGDKKSQSYYRDVVWGKSQLELLVHEPVPEGKKEIVSYWGWPTEYPCWNWTGTEGIPLQVSVYTGCSKVQLELNDNIIDTKTINPDSGITARFEVPYQPGKLKATGFVNDKKVVVKIIKTSGPPSRIQLKADRSLITTDRRDLAYVAIVIEDEEGNRVPDAEIRVNLSLSGEGELLVAGNAKPDAMTSFRQPYCRTYRGRALAIIRPTAVAGEIKLTAEAEGISPASISIQTK